MSPSQPIADPGPEGRVAALEREVARLQHINTVLMDRVERSFDISNSAYSLFESNILLQQRVTARTRELEESHRRLLESQRLQRVMFDQSFYLAGILSPSGILQEANSAALRFAGVTLDQVMGKPLWETPWWTHDPAQQQTLRQDIGRAAEGVFIQREVHHQSSSGELHWIEFSLQPVLGRRHGRVPEQADPPRNAPFRALPVDPSGAPDGRRREAAGGGLIPEKAVGSAGCADSGCPAAIVTSCCSRRRPGTGCRRRPHWRWPACRP